MKKLLSLIIALMLLPGVPRYIGAEEPDYSNLTDASSMTDEELFGKWDEEHSEWSVKPKFNYPEFPAMKPVEEAAKAGIYENAKSELLYYMKNREMLFDMSYDSRNFLFADMWRDNIIVQNGDTIVGVNNIDGSEFKDYTFDASGIVTGRGSYSFMIMQRYKEEAAAEICTRESGFAPEIEIHYSGKTDTIKAVKDTYTHFGSFDVNYGGEPYMYVKESKGNKDGYSKDEYKNLPENAHLYYKSTGPDSKRSYIQFDVTGPAKDEVIDHAFIKIRARSLAEATSIVMFGYNSIIWREKDDEKKNLKGLSWKNAETQVISFNEKKPKPDEDPDYASTADFDYIPVTEMGYVIGIDALLARWQWASIMLGCHHASGDESYAVSLINHTNKFIEAARDNVCMYDGPLDTGQRLNLFVNAYHYLLRNYSIDADSSTAFIKYMWQMAEYLSYNTNYRNNHNHGTFVVRAQQKVVIYMPEFNKHEEWKDLVVYRWNELAGNLMATMDYREGTTGYANTVLNVFNNVITDCEYYGINIGDKFKNQTRKLAAYVAMATFPNGKVVQLGDTGNARPASTIKRTAEILDDDELRYMITNGETGKYPGFDSIYVGGSNNIAIMRSGWGRNDLYGFINVASADGTSHVHPDNLSLDVYAYGRPLIVDSGLKNYNDDEVSNWLRRTTEAHNNITIDKKVQSRIKHGSVSLFNTNKYFDTYKGQEGTVTPFVHTRNIMFVKPCFWIVSDHVSGTDGNEHTYDQNWHFTDDANLALSGDVASTHYEAGADIEVINVENPNVVASLQDGYYGSGSVHEAKYLRFAQKLQEEPVFDTVLFPKEKGKPYEVSTERIDLGVPLSTASAFKMSYTVNGRSADAVVYTSHEATPSARQISTQYSTDARQIYIEQDKEGNLSAINMSDGEVLIKGDRRIISFTNRVRVEDISVVYDSDKVEIFSESMGVGGLAHLRLYTDKDYSKVYFNGQEVACDIDAEKGIITFGGVTDDKIDVFDNEGEMIGAVGDAVTIEGEYILNGSKMTAALYYPEDSVLTGTATWDGTLMKPMGTGTNVDVDGDIAGVVGFTAYDITSDKPLKLTIPYNSSYDYAYIRNNTLSKLVSDKNVNVTYNKDTVEIEFLKGLLDIVIYKEKKQNNSTSGRPSGGGGGGGGGGSSSSVVIPTPTPTPTPTPEPPSQEVSFYDVTGHWAETDILAMAQKDIVKGDNEGNFNPDSFVTRAEFSAFIARFANLEEKVTDAFSDVDENKWYAGSIGAAYEAGLVSGDGDTFRPEDRITREEAAAILSRLEVIKNAEIKNAATIFTDDKEISPWAKTPVDTMTALGIIAGVTETEFAPKAEMTRAMTVVMLARIDKL